MTSHLSPSILRRASAATLGHTVRDNSRTRGNLKAVQKLLGHSSISTTGDIYTHIDQLAETLRGMLDESEM